METTIYKVRDPSGAIRELRGPVGASDEQVLAKAKELFAAAPAPKSGADAIPGQRSISRAEPEPSLQDRIAGIIETPAALAGAAVSGVVTPIAQLGHELFGGQAFTPEGKKAAAEFGKKVQAEFYQPRTQTAREILGGIGSVLEPLGAVPAAHLAQVGTLAAPAAANALAPAQQAATNALARVRSTPAQPAMAGMGAAETAQALQRQTTAEGLRVPVKLTKGEATRLPGQQQFEAETAKMYPETVGKPIIERQRATNDAILSNFDAYADATGATQYGADMLRPVGKVVDDALVSSAKAAKGKINAAYDAAKAAGELEAPVSYQPVFEYIQQQGPTVREKLAPILAGVEDQIKLNDPKGTGQISINALEDVRKFINANTQEGTPNAVHAKQLKQLIDASTEGQGGDLYRQARALRTQYAKDFENAGYVDKLLRNKPGTTDRAVALEDVWNHAIMQGSLDDTHAVALALKKAGPAGQQAWKELQGQTLSMMQDAVTKSVSRDLSGNRIVSPAKFDSIVRELDSSGKLDYIFGKKGAEEIRDLRDTALDVYTKVPGAVNYSNTASALVRQLENLNRSPLGRMPVARQVLGYAEERARTNALTKQVGEALNYNALSR